MIAPLLLASLRTIAAFPPSDAEILLALAEQFYCLRPGQSGCQGLKRVAAYRRFLKLSPAYEVPMSGAVVSSTATEHRRALRQDIFRLGELRPKGWSYPLDCLVREASAHGAQIEVGLAEDLPDEFTLTVQSIGMNKRCQVVRRTERCVGVAFLAA